MQQIFNFIIRNKTFLLFLLLFSISILFTIQSHSFHKSRFINSANFLTGGIYNSVNNVSDYFNLRHQNNILAEENNKLKSLIYNSKDALETSHLDTISYGMIYRFTSANVTKNSYSSVNNILLINKGTKDSIKEDLGVVTSKGILGIIDNTSKNYATVISILHSKSQISAQLKKTNHLGSLVWNGKSPNFVQLIDIPKIAPISIGDTIITSGRSAIFPKGIHIGAVESYKLDNAENFYEVDIKLFNDMTNIEHVSVIENLEREEINNLLNSNN